MTEEQIKQKAKLFIISHKQNIFDISLINLLTLFTTKITEELQQDLNHKRIAIKTRKERIKQLEKGNNRLAQHIVELQKDKGQLIDELTKKADINHSLVEQLAKQNEQLEQAKEIIKKLKSLYFSPVVTNDDLKRQDEILNEAEQFLEE